jgi:hypothetical protein
MPWHEITLDTPDALKDAVIGELNELGAAGVWESGDTELTAYFDNPPNLESIRSLFTREGFPAPEIVFSDVADRDWGEEWKKSWSSFAMGERFFVIPSWLDSKCPEGRLPIFIDPGQAFGTGTHESTQLTLEAMESWPSRQHFSVRLPFGAATTIQLRLKWHRRMLKGTHLGRFISCAVPSTPWRTKVWICCCATLQRM